MKRWPMIATLAVFSLAALTMTRRSFSAAPPHAIGPAAAVALAADCGDRPLGDATDFNVFVLGDLTQQASDTQGRLAVGGNATLAQYSIGGLLQPSATSRDALVVGGKLDFDSGSVMNGDAASVGPAAIAHVSFSQGFGYRQGTVLGFDGAGLALRGLAIDAAALPVTGSTGFEYGQLTLSASDPTLNVFAVAAADLAGANSLTIDAPAGSTALVNISGTAARMGNMGIALRGVDRNHVLYNFPRATTLTLEGVGVQGSILAPAAAIAFNNGVIEGTLVGASLTGPGQANLAPFTGCLPPRASGGGCQQLEASLFVTAASTTSAFGKDDIFLSAGPSARRNSLTPGTTVFYRVVDPRTGLALSDPRGVVVSAAPQGYGTLRVPLAPFGDTSDPGGEFQAQVSASAAFPSFSDPFFPPKDCTLRVNFRLG